MLALLERDADDREVALPVRGQRAGEQAAALAARDGDLPVPGARHLRAVQQPDRVAVDDVPALVEDLCDPVERRALVRVDLVGEQDEVVGAAVQRGGDRGVQAALEMQVHEQPHPDEDEGHDPGEDQGQPEPDGEARQTGAGTHRRYPAPRTVSIDVVPKGRSTFSRRYRT